MNTDSGSVRPSQDRESEAESQVPPSSLPPSRLHEFPEDLRAPWGWGELVLLLAVALVGTLAIGYVLAGAFYLKGVSIAQLRNSASEKSLFMVLNQAFLSFGLLFYLFARIRTRFHLPFWRTLGWKNFVVGELPRGVAYLSCIVGGSLLAVLIQLASATVTRKTRMPIEVFFHDRRSALLLMLMGVLVAPVIEESIFRGYMYPVLARTFGVAGGVVATGALFGLLHAPQLWGGWEQIGLLVIVGIVFTAVRAATRTVLGSYLLHLSYNFFLFLAFFISTSGLRHLPTH